MSRMATPTTKVVKAKKAKAPATVPAPAAIEPVSQEIVAATYEKRAKLAALKAEASALEKAIDAEEAAILTKLKAGAAVQAGPYACGIEVAMGRCTPKWKDEATLLAVANGLTPSAYEATVKAKYPPKPVETLQITKLG